MDRAEAMEIAIKILKEYRRYAIREATIEALDLAIEALREPTVSDDCDNFYKGYCSVYEDGCFHQCKDDCISRQQENL